MCLYWRDLYFPRPYHTHIHSSLERRKPFRKIMRNSDSFIASIKTFNYTRITPTRDYTVAEYSRAAPNRQTSKESSFSRASCTSRICKFELKSRERKRGIYSIRRIYASGRDKIAPVCWSARGVAHCSEMEITSSRGQLQTRAREYYGKLAA